MPRHITPNIFQPGSSGFDSYTQSVWANNLVYTRGAILVLLFGYWGIDKMLRYSLSTKVMNYINVQKADWNVDTGIYFDYNTSSAFAVPNFRGLAGASQATIIYYGYTYSAGAQGRTYAQFSNASTDIRFGIDVGGPGSGLPNKINGLTNGATAYGQSPTLSPTTEGWSVWAFVFNGTLTGNAERLKLYRDGVQITPLTFTGTIPATAPAGLNRFDVGRFFSSATATYGFSGCWNVVVYDRALSAMEVAAVGSGTHTGCWKQVYPRELGFFPGLAPAGFFRNRMASRGGLGRHLTGIGNSV